jgi:hypothetical protein
MRVAVYFERFTLDLPEEAVAACSHQGACDEDVERWAPLIVRPDDCTVERLADELREYGAWDGEQLADDVANWQRIVWIAAGNVAEERRED